MAYVGEEADNDGLLGIVRACPGGMGDLWILVDGNTYHSFLPLPISPQTKVGIFWAWWESGNTAPDMSGK